MDGFQFVRIQINWNEFLQTYAGSSLVEIRWFLYLVGDSHRNIQDMYTVTNPFRGFSNYIKNISIKWRSQSICRFNNLMLL